MNKQSIADLQETWTLLFPGREVPSTQQCAYWLFKYGSEVMREAISSLAERFIMLNGEMDDLWMARYLSAAARRLGGKTSQRGVATALAYKSRSARTAQQQ